MERKIEEKISWINSNNQETFNGTIYKYTNYFYLILKIFYMQITVKNYQLN